MKWKVKQILNAKLSNVILIEGLPGIGNVGKVAVDFIIDEMSAKKMYEFTSYTLPHSVFINEHNLAELPKIEMFYAHDKKHDYLFLNGDVQPSDEESCYEFTEQVISVCRKHGCMDIITLGGIGLLEIPKRPKIFCTGNSKKAVEKYKAPVLHTNLYGVVGPIVGVSGLLLGMADHDMHAVSLLAETYGHPMYLGVAGAKEIVKYLNKRFSFNLDLSKLDKEIKEMENEIMKRTEDLSNVSRQAAAKKLKGQGEVNYIG